MSVKKHPLDIYKRFLLSRSTVTSHFTETIENLLAVEDELISYCFHKVMIHHWTGAQELLFDTIFEYFSVTFLPVNVTNQGDLLIFYTCSLSLIMRLIRQEFMFLHQFNMYNIDVVFNDKTSADFFDNNITIDDVVSSVISRRFDDKQQLDLSNICEEQEFIDKKMYFYKINILSYFKILMLRVGKDTKSLNLSHNKLTHPPLDIMNFFIKGDLTEMNLSYNLIPSMSDLMRVNSKIEKLWLEGNPLCEGLEPFIYVKQITVKFPRLVELDGIKLNEFTGLVLPFNRNYITDSTPATKMVVEKFIMLYFTHYDSDNRKVNIEGFYNNKCTLTISIPAAEFHHQLLARYSKHATNMLRQLPGRFIGRYRPIHMKTGVLNFLGSLPQTVHDPATFTVDVVRIEKHLVIIVDGIFKEKGPETIFSPVLRFRRTFVFSEYNLNNNTVYRIKHEMLHVDVPSVEQMANCFKNPIRDMNSLELISPEREETETILKIFVHLSQLKKEEAEARLRMHKWDLRKALQTLLSDIMSHKIRREHFIEEDDFSDSSSLIEEMVD